MPWTGYPESASEQARRALRHREENGSSCGTAVGWQRADQLAGREALSDDTVKRTYSFLSRAKVYDQGKFTDEDGAEICGSVMYAAWGGDPMLRWAERTVEKINERAMKPKRNQLQKLLNTNFLSLNTAAMTRHIARVEEDEQSVTITFWKEGYEASPDAEDTTDMERAAADELRVGDYVSWRSSAGRSYGRIEEVERGGDVLVASSGFEIVGTQDDPAALISVYDRTDADTLRRRSPELLVVHRFSTLSREDAAQFERMGGRKPEPEQMQREGVQVRMWKGGVKYDKKTREISGYGIVFEEDSVPLPISVNGRQMVVVERIHPDALAAADMGDVIATYNHSGMFARTSSGTMSLEFTPAGVRYRFSAPNTTAGNDLIEMVNRGDVRGSSFGFYIDEKSYRLEERDENTIIAYAMKIEKIVDMGPVDHPAYPATEKRFAALAGAVEQYFRSKESKGPDDVEDDETEFEKAESLPIEKAKLRLTELSD